MDSTKLLTLQLKDDLREEIAYSNHSIPFSICIDHFDHYLNREWGSHWHDEYEFGLVLKGRVEFTIYVGGKETLSTILEKGDGIFVGSGFLHSVRALIPGTVMAGFVFSNAFFNMRPFESVMHDLIQPLIDHRISHVKFDKEEENMQGILNTMDTLCHIPKEESRYELHCIELVFRLWRLTLDYITQIQEEFNKAVSDTSRTQRLKLMVSYIHAHYNESVSVNDIAKYAGISRTECFRCFQGILHKTPTEYLTDYRLSMASMLLTTTKRTLTDISESCGFSSPSYFGKMFKARYGVSPKKYAYEAVQQ